VNNNPANPVIGVRSYGERPELVAKLGSAAIRGYQAGGVAACAKHFPGHGDTVADSHLELPVVPHDPRRLDRVELAPFRAAVEAGVDAVMTAHVRFPAHEDRAIPATLSPRILTGLLRERLGFSGMIVTDCLEMKAISDTVGIGRGAVMAVKAGADLVLVSHRLDRQLKALEALHDAVLSGEIGMERIDDAVRRILAAKRRRIMAAPAAPAAGSGVPEAWDVARRACERAVTVVKNECGALPLRRELPVLAVWPEVRRSTEVDEALRPAVTLGKALETRGFRAREIVIGSEPARDEWMAVVEEARGGGYRQNRRRHVQRRLRPRPAGTGEGADGLDGRICGRRGAAESVRPAAVSRCAGFCGLLRKPSPDDGGAGGRAGRRPSGGGPAAGHAVGRLSVRPRAGGVTGSRRPAIWPSVRRRPPSKRQGIA